jgi:P-type Mg2+ transporter
LSIMAFGMWLPYSPLAHSLLGLTHLPRMYWPILMLTLLGYVSTQMIKAWLVRNKWT